MYIKRNHQGDIIALSKVAAADFTEQLADDDAQLLAFLQSEKSSEQLALEQTDTAMARVLEDVVGLLVEQGVIRFTDLPAPAQDKLLARRELRGGFAGFRIFFLCLVLGSTAIAGVGSLSDAFLTGLQDQTAYACWPTSTQRPHLADSVMASIICMLR